MDTLKVFLKWTHKWSVENTFKIPLQTGLTGTLIIEVEIKNEYSLALTISATMVLKSERGTI